MGLEEGEFGHCEILGEFKNSQIKAVPCFFHAENSKVDPAKRDYPLAEDDTALAVESSYRFYDKSPCNYHQ